MEREREKSPKSRSKSNQNKEPETEGTTYLKEMLRKQPSEKLLNNVVAHAEELEADKSVDNMAVGEHYIAAANIAQKLGDQAKADAYMTKATKYISQELYKQAVRMANALKAKGAKEVTVGVTILGIQVSVTFEVSTIVVADTPQPAEK